MVESGNTYAPAFPQALSWDQRCKGVQPMPGGSTEFLTSLSGVATYVEEHHPTIDKLEQWWAEECDLTPFSSRSRLNFLIRTKLLTSDTHGCEIGHSTRTWLEHEDPSYVVAQLHAGARFVGELLDAIREPKSLLELLRYANDEYACGWETKNQVQFRVNWLQSARAISVSDDRRWSLTEGGSAILEALVLHTPLVPAPQGNVENAELSPAIATTASSSEDAETQQAIRLASELIEASTDAGHHTRFEHAVHECLQYLGYESELLGKSGRADVLLTAPLGRGASYRVAVEAKTTAKGSLVDHLIDWATLTEHREKIHKTDYSLLVGPNPTGQRLEQRAIDHGVVVMSADELASLCRQHSRLALGLDTYRALFASPGFVDTTTVDEQAEEALRVGRIAALVQRRVASLGDLYGAVSARDILMSLADSDLGDLEDTVVVEDDIRAALDFLSSPLVRSLHVANSAAGGSEADPVKPTRYLLSTSPAVSRLSLTQASNLLDPLPQCEDLGSGSS